MWLSDGTASEFFRGVMSQNRFHQLVRAIRFDDQRSRNDHKKTDNLAPIRKVLKHLFRAVPLDPRRVCHN